MTMKTDEWYEWRRNGIGASEIAGIMGQSPWSSPWSIWAHKVGLLKDTNDGGTDSMQFGTDLEPVIAAWFTRETGLYVAGEQTWGVEPDLKWARATLDGFVSESGNGTEPVGVFEAKYDGDSPWETVPAHYVMQVQWQMFVTGLPHAWLACMHLPFGRPAFQVYEVERDDSLISEMRTAGERFWKQHVVTGDPPATDGHQATTAALRDVYGDAGDARDVRTVTVDTEAAVNILRVLKAQAKDVKTEIAELENAVKAELADCTEGVDGDGQLIVSWRPQTANRLDTKRLRADHAELADGYMTESTSRVLRLPKPKK